MLNSPSRQLGKWIDTKTVFLFRGTCFSRRRQLRFFFFASMGFSMHGGTHPTHLRHPGCHIKIFVAYNVLGKWNLSELVVKNMPRN